MSIKFSAVSPKQIEESRQRAAAACSAAYAPQAIPQPGGGVLSLCYMGRIARGYEMLRAGDNPALRQGLTALQQKARDAFEIAEKAATDYAALCASVGATTEDVYPAQCQCEGCLIDGNRHNYHAAAADLRRAVWSLLLPTHLDAPLPALVELVEATGEAQESQRKELWQRICNLAKAQKDFREACLALGRTPEWQKVFW